MRRMLGLLGVGVVMIAGVGCHCVAGKCDCTGDKIITHPYSMCAEVHELLSLEPNHGHHHGDVHSAGLVETVAPPDGMHGVPAAPVVVGGSSVVGGSAIMSGTPVAMPK